MVIVGIVLYVIFGLTALNFFIALLPTGHTVQVTMPQSIPGRLRTLADHGRLVYVVKRRPPLPRRVPGASLLTNSPDVMRYVHVTEMPTSWFHRTTHRIVTRVDRFTREWILGKSETFAHDWATGWNRDLSGYVPRHSHTRMSTATRRYWADWPTQWWPTLATEVDWYAIQQRSFLTHCHGVPVVGSIRTMNLRVCTSEPVVYRIEGSDADHPRGTRPGGQVDARGSARDAAGVALPTLRRAAPPEPADESSAR